MEPNYFSRENTFTHKLCLEDEEKLAVAQKRAQAFSGYKARREALKVKETTGYNMLREAALRYHGFAGRKTIISTPNYVTRRVLRGSQPKC